MALSGLFLSLFLIVHVSGNLALFKHDAGKSFNEYTVFMTSFPPIKIISYLLYATFALHIANGFYLVYRNQKARPVAYAAKKDTRSSSWASRNMGLLGSILFFFLVIHMGNFWFQYKFGSVPYTRYVSDPATGLTTSAPYERAISGNLEKWVEGSSEVVVVKDLFQVVASSFSNPIYVIFYVISMIALSYHMFHGFQSAFQTLGIRPGKAENLIKWTGTLVFALIIPVLFAAMPVYFLIFN